MRIRGLIAIALLFFVSNSFGQSKAQSFAKTIKVSVFKEKLDKVQSAQIVDVRTPGEWESGIIPNAKKINVYDSDFEEKLNALDKNKTVFVYCKSGGRSSRAMSKMKTMGFKRIYNLSGGITAWKTAGYAVTR